MSVLVETRTELEAKQKALHDIFAQYPDLDMPEDVVKDIQAKNAELSDLGAKFDRLKELERIRVETEAEVKGQRTPAQQMRHPSDEALYSKGQPARPEVISLARAFVESDAFKSYDRARKWSPTVDIDIKGLLDYRPGAERKTLLDETGYTIRPPRINVIVSGALRRPVVSDLMPQGTTNTNAIIYMEETTTTNAAAAVAEGGTKPESALGFTERTANVRKVATVLPVTDELMADAPAIEAYIEARLRLFLALSEETELLSGSGSSPHITGLLNASGILTQPTGTDPQPDAIYKAIVKIATTSFLEPSGMIINPLNWQSIRLLRTTEGIYIWGNPADPGPDRIWGLTVVPTVAMTSGTALVGAFDTAAQIFRRDQVSFAVSDQHADFFITNRLMLRVEERLALAIYRPNAFCTVTSLP